MISSATTSEWNLQLPCHVWPTLPSNYTVPQLFLYTKPSSLSPLYPAGFPMLPCHLLDMFSLHRHPRIAHSWNNILHSTRRDHYPQQQWRIWIWYINVVAFILTFTNSYKFSQALCISPNPRPMTIKINPTVVKQSHDVRVSVFH